MAVGEPSLSGGPRSSRGSAPASSRGAFGFGMHTPQYQEPDGFFLISAHSQWNHRPHLSQRMYLPSVTVSQQYHCHQRSERGGGR